MVFLCGVEFWTPRVARGIKGSGPRLTFDLKRTLSNLKMKPEKLELESTHPETLAMYTHTLKRSGWFFLLTTNTTTYKYLYSYGCHTTGFLKDCFLFDISIL